MAIYATGDTVNTTLGVGTTFYLISGGEARDLSIFQAWSAPLAGTYAVDVTNFPEIEANKAAAVGSFWNELISPMAFAAGPNSTPTKPTAGYAFYRLRLTVSTGGIYRARIHQVR
jgi:hypothetical protein